VAVGGDPEAPAIVLVHGLGGTWRSWGRVPERLAARFRLVAVDLPGFGGSRPLPGRVFPLDDVAVSLAEALDDLGVEEHLLCGHSMGGGVSITYAADRPSRVSALVLVAPAGLVATGAVRPSWRRPFVHRVGREMTRLAVPLVLASGRARRAGFARLVHDPGALSAADALALVRGSVRGRATGPAGITIVYAGLRDRLHLLEMPTLVIWGDEDRVIEAAGGARLVESLPDGRLLRLPETGHLPAIERPDAVVAAIGRLADEVAPGAP
jgi:pimeloyl-ACP methyl ester carboxylesterase